MYNIGNGIVYPSQGIGIIKSIEERVFNGSTQNYYKINLINKNLDILIPEQHILNSTIRHLNDPSTIDNLLNTISDISNSTEDDVSKTATKQRMMDNTSKFKSGTFIEYLEILCNLTKVNNDHPLNNVEKEMYKNTQEFLMHEISNAKNISTSEAKEILSYTISQI